MKKTKAKKATVIPGRVSKEVFMSPDELRTYVDIGGKLNTSQEGFARFVNVRGRTVRDWIADRAPIPKAVVLLIKLMVKTKTKPEDL